jgi:tRNA threonylcarbamoyladenosine biosynthesis protein TsaB
MDTAGPRASLALGDDGGAVLAEAAADVAVRSSEALLPALQALLGTASVAPADLRGIVLGRGPGSYTGLRIGAAAAKGLVHALSRPLFAHGSLEAMSAGADAAGRVLMPLIHARRGEVFVACHRRCAHGVVELAPPALLALADAVALALEHDALAIGAGASAHARALEAAGVAVDPDLATRAAAGLLLLHASAGDAARVEDPRRWEPVYLRPAEDQGGQPTG